MSKINYANFAAKVKAWSDTRVAVWHDGIEHPVTDPALKKSLVGGEKTWRDLAKNEVEYANEFCRDQPSKDTAMRRAFTYEAAALAMAIELKTGVAICTCHHLPFKNNADWCNKHPDLSGYGIGGNNFEF